jgi:hypothetical protein
MTISLPDYQRLGQMVSPSPSEVPGLVAPFDVNGQTTVRTRIETPTGAQMIFIQNDCEVDLLVVFNLSGTSEADAALAESAAAGGGVVAGVSYRRIKAGTGRAFPFPDQTDRLYYTDFKAASSISPGGRVWGEAVV